MKNYNMIHSYPRFVSYEIPPDWKSTDFGKIAKFVRGISYSTSDLGNDKTRNLLINLNCFKKGGGFIDKGLIYFNGKTKKTAIEPDEILIAITDVTREGNVIGYPLITPREYNNKSIFHSMDTAHLKLKTKDVDKKFLFYFLCSDLYHQSILGLSAGSTVLHLDLDSVNRIKIPYPPTTEEQQKIGSILSNIDELIQKQKQVIEQTQKLRKGQMQKLLTSGLKKNDNLEPISPYGKQFQKFFIPKTWKVKKLAKLCQIITDGSHFSPEKEGEYPLVTVENMRDNKIDINSCYKIHKSDYDYLVKNNCQPKNNDVLFSKDGTIGLCLTYTQPDKIVVLSSIAIIRTKPEELDPNFLKYVMLSRYMEVYVSKYKSGTALKRIILERISEFLFPLPPTIEEQQKIASILSNLDLLIQQEKQHKEKLEKIKRGLMQQLLIGQKRVKL